MVTDGAPLEPAPPAAGPSGDDEAARRRRHIRFLALVAIAALVVAALIGVVTGQALDDNDIDPAMSEEIAADNPVRTGQPSGTAAPVETPTETRLAASAGPAATERVVVRGPARKVRAARLRADLVSLQHWVARRPGGASYDHTTLATPKDFVCADGDYGHGLLLGVLYDDQPALVAFRDPVGSTQVADVLSCGTADTIHSLTLRLR